MLRGLNEIIHANTLFLAFIRGSINASLLAVIAIIHTGFYNNFLSLNFYMNIGILSTMGREYHYN